MKLHVLSASLLIFQVAVESKPLEASRDFEASNEVDYAEARRARPIERQRAAREPAARGKQEEGGGNEDARRDERSSEDVIVGASDAGGDVRAEESPVNGQQYSPFPNLLVPLLQRLQFSPQTFFQDRLKQLKDGLVNFGLAAPADNSTATAKQFPAPGGILNLVGLNDSGFYTDRLEPAGFLGGNGWFANKGGILGGPGAIYSTGSLFTDYPTAYRK